MKILILNIFLILSHCDEVDENVSREQLALFRQITDLNQTQAELVWKKVEDGIVSSRNRRSTDDILPKFRYGVTAVSII